MMERRKFVGSAALVAAAMATGADLLAAPSLLLGPVLTPAQQQMVAGFTTKITNTITLGNKNKVLVDSITRPVKLIQAAPNLLVYRNAGGQQVTLTLRNELLVAKVIKLD